MNPGRLISLTALFALTVSATWAQDATITVRADEPGPRISPRLYGLFFEEINHAGDGGLYAELVRNRGFEDAATPEGWSLLKGPDAEGLMALDDTHPLTAADPHSLRVEVRSGRVGVVNDGYWGIAVRKGAAYRLSFHARAERGFRGPILVALKSAAGQVYDWTALDQVGTEWRPFAATLTPDTTDPAARLVIAADGPCAFWLDMVSLFPADTWKGRPNGLRADLAKMLNEVAPSFVRFPGGCFVEGDQLANAFRWKDTIGDLQQRPGHWNLWGYRSTDGLGLHEYLQMCEDLGAEPLFVINCGMSHGGNVPMDDMSEWVQDALDAIEYANGPTYTKWGALRARNGHPEPFGLRMMEIGNENGGPAYEERYALFRDAIKARHPGMKLVANVPVTSRPMDVLDEHYYSSPDWFASQARKYDSYDRDGPEIYVGEYACTQGCGQGNLRAALGEAAFMTGMERNSDVVTMASYAPLFVSVSDRRWNPDAICFDSSRCYGTPSYHVQRLFSRNRGDTVLPIEVECDSLSPSASGAIGLGTWATEAEFKDITVTSGDRVLFGPDSTGGPAWRVFRGNWRGAGGAYRQTSPETDVRSMAGDINWTDYTLSLKARKLGGAEGFLIMFHVRDNDNWFWWNLGGWGNVRHALEKCSGGGKSIVGPQVPGSIETGRWYDIRIELTGSRIRCYLDGRLITEATDSELRSLYATSSRDIATGEVIVKVVNYSDRSQRATVSLRGVRNVGSRGRAIVLTSASPDDENSFAEPTKVTAVERRFTCPGPTFSYAFAPYSVTVLRVEVTDA